VVVVHEVATARVDALKRFVRRREGLFDNIFGWMPGNSSRRATAAGKLSSGPARPAASAAPPASRGMAMNQVGNPGKTGLSGDGPAAGAGRSRSVQAGRTPASTARRSARLLYNNLFAKRDKMLAAPFGAK
jgi:hypothetical protein